MKVKFMQGDFNNDLIEKVKNENKTKERSRCYFLSICISLFLKNKKTLKNVLII